MKIAVVSPYALDRHGGVQSQASQLVEHLIDAGHEAWLTGPGRSGPEGARLLGRATAVPGNGALAPIGLDPRMIGRVRRAIAGADLVHVHEPLMPLIGPAALFAASVPVVGTFHADPSGRIRGVYRFAAPFLRRIGRRMNRVTAVSVTAESAIRPFVSGVTIIPNALDTSRYETGSDRQPSRVAFLGRDDPRKGLDVLLEAWPDVLQRVPEAELTVVGTRRAAGPPGVSFLGRVPEDVKLEALASSSVFCAPNLGGESFGIALLEGMAAGCATVASDLSAFRHVGATTVEYVPVGDAGALAAALTAKLLDPALQQVGASCRARAKLFDWVTVLPSYLDQYRLALGGH
jgi:phosphatidylinositol alpha-mannosyltransferase